jgi:hypothetical protein
MFSVHRTLLFALLGACASTVLASAQAPTSQTDPGTDPSVSSPVAYVYVASSNGSKDQIKGYAAASNGSLTAIPGSPFPYNVNSRKLHGIEWRMAFHPHDEEPLFSIGAGRPPPLKDKLTVVTNGDRY